MKAAQAKYVAYRDVELAREETEREKNRQVHEREKERIENGESVKIELERLKAQRKAEQEKIKAIQKEGRERLRFEKKMHRLEYKRERERNLTEDERMTRIALKSLLVIGVIIFIIVQVVLYNEAHTPASSKDCIGKQYTIVQKQFTDAGFKDVRSEVVGDLSDTWLYKATDKVDTVKEVSVNGEFDFYKGKTYSKSSPVVVYYHAYPDSAEE